MSEKDAYNKGVASGIRLNNEIMHREIEAMDFLKEKLGELGKSQKEMGEAVDALIEDRDAEAVERIFGIVNKKSPKNLKDHEKKVLLNVIATLGVNGLNKNQKRYFNNLHQFVKLNDYVPDTKYSFANIENIDSISALKIIAKAIRAFLFLREENLDEVYKHEEDVFSYFELSGFDEIDAEIELLYHLFGDEGLTELYKDNDPVIVEVEKEVIVEKTVEEKINMHPDVGKGYLKIHKTNEAVYCGKRGRLVWDWGLYNEITFECYETGVKYSLWKGDIAAGINPVKWFVGEDAEYEWRSLVEKYGI